MFSKTINFILVTTLIWTQCLAHADDRPNILLILTDNTGWGDWGAYGGGELRGAPSPRIDQLAKEGLTLLNFNTEPQCTPSRSALMTGRFAIRSGNQAVPVGTPLYGLVPWEETIAEVLSRVGYRTGIFGKWHLGNSVGRYPTDQGFDEWYGIANSNDEVYWNEPELLQRVTDAADAEMLLKGRRPFILEASKGEQPRHLEPYDLNGKRLIDLEITHRTIDFMRRGHESGKPFFAYVPMSAMHFPTLPAPEFAGRSGHGDYTDMLMQTDHLVGQMLDALEQMGIAENTLVIFAADNGVESPDNGDGQFNGWAGPWAGTYFTALEGGLRAPFIARWPGWIPAGSRNNEIVHLVDVFPTLASITGATVPADRPIDGINMADFLTSKSEESGREGFPVFVGNELYAVKWHDWKVHFIWQASKYSPKQVFSTIPKVVNLIQDPREERQAAEPYNTWTQFMQDILVRFQLSARQYPHVPVGAPNDYRPAY
jgi:arylsulfatase